MRISRLLPHRREAGTPAPPRRQSTNHALIALEGLTGRGRAFLAAGITSTTAGVMLDQRDLVRVGALLIALPLAAAAFLTRARYRIAAERRIDQGRAVIGGIVRVEIEVRNLGRLATPLLLAQDALPPELGAAADGGARFVLDRIPADTRRTVSYGVRPEQRGRYEIGPLSVRLADPFGFCQILRTFSATNHLRVLPEVVALPSGGLGGQWSAGGDGRQHGISTSGEQDATTRPYVTGDDRRRVHWRTTARTGELSVRREEQPWQSKATLLIDTREDAHSPGFPSASFEVAVSAAASFATALTRGGFDLRLIDDVGRIVADSARAPGSQGSAASFDGGLLVMDALADLDTGTGSTLLPMTNQLHDETGSRGSVIAVLGRLRPGDLTALEQVGRRSGRCLAMLVDADSWTPNRRGRGAAAPSDSASLAADALRRAGWSVAVARPQTSLGELWHELNSVDPSQTRRWVG